MSLNRYYNPVRTLFGEHALRQLPQLAKACVKPTEEILILAWDQSVADLDGVKQLREELGCTIHFHVVTCSNPEVSDLYAVYEQVKQQPISLVVGIGGGSILDVAKSLCMLFSAHIESEEELRSMIKSASYPASSCRWIGIPTTAGTGSEVTCWATIWDSPQKAKYSISSEENYAYACINDPILTQSMPLSLAISSALDAMAHAIESYWARATNATSRLYALEAISLLVKNIPALAEQPRSAEATAKVAHGSMLAGLAFSNTKTTAGHSISYPLTMKFNIPHGVAVSLVLAEVFAINMEQITELAPLMAALSIESSDDLRQFLKGMLTLAKYPTTLSDYGVTADDLEDLAAHSLTKGRADNNPVDLTEKSVVELLKNIL